MDAVELSCKDNAEWIATKARKELNGRRCWVGLLWKGMDWMDSIPRSWGRVVV